MKIMDEGVIKYDKSNFQTTPSLPDQEFRPIERWRKRLNQINLIGAYSNGLGFGNISQKRSYINYLQTENPQFIITGSQTGKHSDLNGNHYTRIINYDIKNFKVWAMGPVDASSETVTHASIYEQNPNIGAIIHVHSEKIWKKMIKENCPSTSRWIQYGTYEMAMAVKECVKDSTQGIFVMEGHHEGIVSYGPNLPTAGGLILKAYSKYVDSNYHR